LAIREVLEQPPLPEMDRQISLPFPTMNFGSVKYEVVDSGDFSDLTLGSPM
jgi:hypothetical protein